MLDWEELLDLPSRAEVSDLIQLFVRIVKRGFYIVQLPYLCAVPSLIELFTIY